MYKMQVRNVLCCANNFPFCYKKFILITKNAGMDVLFWGIIFTEISNIT